MLKSLWVKIRAFWLWKAWEQLCMDSYLDTDERVIRSIVSEQLDNMCKCFHLKFCSLPLSQKFVSVLPSDD